MSLVGSKRFKETRQEGSSTNLEFLSFGVTDLNSFIKTILSVDEFRDFSNRAQSEVQAFTVTSLSDFLSDQIADFVDGKLTTSGRGRRISERNIVDAISNSNVFSNIAGMKNITSVDGDLDRDLFSREPPAV